MSDIRLFKKQAERHLELIAFQENDDLASGKRKNGYLTEEVETAPVFSFSAHLVLQSQPSTADDVEEQHIYSQYGLLGHRLRDTDTTPSHNELVYTNVSAPWSVFICGSQGSGKSHSLSCLLENCLISSSPAGKLSSPLAGLVLHYDKFTAFSSTQLCEAAYLCSAKIPVRVLVSPTNYVAMKNAYTKLIGLGDVSHLLTVEPMYLPQEGLNIAMMRTLMGLGDKKSQPLYIEMVMKILREMAIANQGRKSFNYKLFRRRLDEEQFMKGQEVPLKMRLDVLESFFEPEATPGAQGKKSKTQTDKIWKFEKGTLTIIDLSCPFVDPDDACALFNICISLFLKDRHEAGRVLALDEAHKFLGATSAEALDLTDTLLSIVRQQRHLGTRVIIATQEPTMSPSLLDLCNVTIIHRFTSPAWFKAIKSHIAGASLEKQDGDEAGSDFFHRIVSLATGEALLFCPAALVDVEKHENNGNTKQTYGSAPVNERGFGMTDGYGVAHSHRVMKLGSKHLHLRIRKRITADGGRSLIEK
ncbi:uncharacterized protein N7459_001365 [Penicillium hispanicum]|uniref:uncharacterized protein n=1 Tax=Penicillium hispanicum TaxID=1080232 RepID=UPI00253FE169|nr:uncharacterized protein N7459_001365 [Penicillium hispanicum]KAJ5595157.1 hypothetical protein N7459_001365 [Penicillium hispanicum]